MACPLPWPAPAPAGRSPAPPPRQETGKRAHSLKLRLEVVRVFRKRLGAVLGHQHEILEPDAAEAVAVEARLDSDHIAGDELAGPAAERRLLVHLEPDPVTERVVEAVLQHLSRL